MNSLAPVSSSSYELLLMEMLMNILEKHPIEYQYVIHDAGIEVGVKLGMIFTAERTARFSNEVDCVKWLCKEVWRDILFGHIAGRLQTDRQSLYVIHDDAFPWFKNISGGSETDTKVYNAYGNFCAGILQGCLESICISSTVTCILAPENLKLCSFQIQCHHS